MNGKLCARANGTKRVLSVVPVCAVLLATGAVNVCNLAEAYGSGAPYYSRSTNMGKWADPLPILGALDAAVLIVPSSGHCGGNAAPRGHRAGPLTHHHRAALMAPRAGHPRSYPQTLSTLPRRAVGSAAPGTSPCAPRSPSA